MIPRLGADPLSPFPPVESALEEPDGLLAWGGDLDPLRLLAAYRAGIFPWYTAEQPILWWCPSRRCIIRPADVHVSRRLARTLKRGAFRVTADRAFRQVVAGCALPRPGQGSTWITPAMARAYERMHRLGHGHSVEVWSNDRLAGGIYGLSLGNVFFGESMFSLCPDASKIALVSLCRQLHAWNFTLLDCQVCNPHLARMGAEEISRNAFCEALQKNPERTELRGSWASHFAAGEAFSPTTAGTRK